MNILKVLQKKQNEQPLSRDEIDNFISPGEIERRGDNKPPELFTVRDLQVKTSNAVSVKHSDSFADKARPDSPTERVGETVLDAFDLTSPSEKRLPKFAVWNIDAERVNLRLVAITEPKSNYCEEYRSLRTQVLHKSQRQKLQSIVVASINPSEGKSVTALNLSWLWRRPTASTR